MIKNTLFKGLVEDVGIIKSIQPAPDSKTYIMKVTAAEFIKGLHTGDRVAVNGVCLSINELHEPDFTVHIWPATQTKTALLQLAAGDKVNLEHNRCQEGFGSETECPY